ncbi:hypothetical protein ACA910_004186 [Epithemia clementina (nom. ined.)]
MQPSPLVSAVSLNDQALAYLEIRSYETAAGFISNAVELVKGEFSKDDPPASTPRRKEQLSSWVSTDRSAPSYIFPTAPTNADVQQQNTSHESCNGVFVFNKPIIIALPTDAQSPPSYECLVSISSTLLYNLALIHHMWALESKCRPHLQKAAALYELASSVEINRYFQVSVLLTMAIINNLGQINFELGDAECAQQYFGFLMSTLVVVQDSDHLEVAPYRSSFVANIVKIIFREPQPAPSA